MSEKYRLLLLTPAEDLEGHGGPPGPGLTPRGEKEIAAIVKRTKGRVPDRVITPGARWAGSTATGLVDAYQEAAKKDIKIHYMQDTQPDRKAKEAPMEALRSVDPAEKTVAMVVHQADFARVVEELTGHPFTKDFPQYTALELEGDGDWQHPKMHIVKDVYPRLRLHPEKT